MPRLTLPALSAPAAPLTRASRSGPVLHDTPLTGTHDVPGLNVARGCGHRCAFCCVRAGSGEDALTVYADTADRLREELRHCRVKAVFVSPGTDPFPRQREVQQAAAEVAEVLAEHGVEAWFMTRGLILPSVLDRLEPIRDRVRITVGIATTDRTLQRKLEEGAAPPSLRLKQIAKLRNRGFRVQVSLEPLMPGLTDTQEALGEILDALSAVGVTQVTASYLFLRTGIAEQLRAALPGRLAEPLLQAFENGPLLTAPGLAAARYLPRGRRQRGYATLMALAATRGINVNVTALTNPDFAPVAPVAAKRAEGPGLLRRYLQARERTAG